MSSPLFNVTTTTTSDANLRATPEMATGNVLRVVPKGAGVTLGGNARGWILARYDGTTGYISNTLLNPAWRLDLAWTSVVVDTDNLNVRAEPAMGDNVIGVVFRNEELTVTGLSGTWLRILYEEQVAWVGASYTAEPPEPAPPVVPPLSPEELKAERARIGELDDKVQREDAYEALQARVLYASQRDNASKEANGDLVEIPNGRMCNLTALAMALSYMGYSNPHPEMQYEDALEKVRVDNGLPERWKAEGWGGVAQKVGADVVFVKGSDFCEGRAWWKDTVRAILRSGSAVILSITGHIVRLQAVTDDGLVVDDPYGRSELESGADYGFSAVNPYQKSGVLVGDDVLWTWEEVERHTMHWLAKLWYPKMPVSHTPGQPPRLIFTTLPAIVDEQTSNPKRRGLVPDRSSAVERERLRRELLTPEAIRLRPG